MQLEAVDNDTKRQLDAVFNENKVANEQHATETFHIIWPTLGEQQ